MTFSPTGDKLYITANNSSSENVNNGKLVVLNRTVVPEPATLTMLLAGAIAALAGCRRRS